MHQSVHYPTCRGPDSEQAAAATAACLRHRHAHTHTHKHTHAFPAGSQLTRRGAKMLRKQALSACAQGRNAAGHRQFGRRGGTRCKRLELRVHGSLQRLSPQQAWALLAVKYGGHRLQNSIPALSS